MHAVSDATPLIHLSKISKIRYLEKLFRSIYIPKGIFEEVVVKGKELEKKEVMLVEELIEKKFIIIKDASSTIEIPNLHYGELKAIALCRELKIKNLLIDDKEGFDAAVVLDLKPLRTTALLLRMLKRKILNFNEYKESLLNLSESGFFLSAETYEKLLNAGRQMRR